MSEHRPSTSVILPTIRPDLLPAALQNIAAQRFNGDLEVIVIHDGGDPLEMATSPFPVRSIGVKPRLGPSQARNVAAALAQGDLLAFCDDDDGWHPLHLQKTADLALAEQGVVFTDALMENVAEGWTKPFRFRFGAGVLRRTNPIILSTVVMARSAWQKLGGFDAGLSRYEAWDLFLRAEEMDIPIRHVPEVTVTYRYSARSITADDAAMAASFVRFRDKHKLSDLRRASFATMLTDPAFADLREGGEP